MELPQNFYKLVEQKGFLEFILYGDTDSIFLTLPVKNAASIPVAERWKIAEHSAKEINKLIVGYTTGTLLPRCNIDPARNQTFFKTELLIDAAMFMEVKKNYSYLLSCKEGKVIDPPKPSHTGIPVIKSDAASLTQDMLGSMIVDVMLNSEIKRIDRAKAIVELVSKFKKTFEDNCDKYEFDYLGFPAKWSKKEIFIQGMKLYNFIMNEEVFNLGSSGKFVHCVFRNASLLHSDFKAMKSPGIVVPYEYNIEQIKQLFERYQIEINRKTHWSKLFNTSCQRVVDLAKKEAKSIL
jgi:hypothetical protein